MTSSAFETVMLRDDSLEKSCFHACFVGFSEAFCKMDSTLDHSQTQADSWFESQPLGTKDRKEASLRN